MTMNEGNIQPMELALRESLQGMFFKGDPSPGELFAGLSSAALPDGDSITLEELEDNEVQAIGYRRIMLEAAKWEQTIEDGLSIVRQTAGFLHTGEEPWPGVKSLFISTLSVRGGILVSVSEIQFSPVVVTPGSSLSAELTIAF